MFEKEDKYFIVVSLVLALILLSLSFNFYKFKEDIAFAPGVYDCKYPLTGTPVYYAYNNELMWITGGQYEEKTNYSNWKIYHR